MRQEAWKIATSKWSFRMLFVLGFYFLVTTMVLSALDRHFQAHSVQTWGDFLQLQAKFMRSGMVLTVPSSQQFWSMTWATGFSRFLALLFNGLLMFGFLSTALKAVRGEDTGWLGAAFGGLRIPLELLWLNILMSLRIMLWSMLFVIPGIIAIYRYAMAWYVKSDHPEMSASECLAESARLMKGQKWRLFCFQLSYIGWGLMVALLMVGVGALSATMPFAASAASASALALTVFTFIYVFLGQAVFYRELPREAAPAEAVGAENLSEAQSETSVEK